MKTVLIVGKSFSGLKSAILEKGDDYIVLQDQRTAKNPSKHYKRRILADFSSFDLLKPKLDEIRNKVDAVITIFESYVLPTAQIASYLNLPGLPVTAAEACTDKYVMRQLFAKAPKKISPDFAEVLNKESLLDFAKKHHFPLILKPANLAKSLLVTKSNNIDELLANYQKTTNNIDAIYKKYAPDRTPKVIIEEFMQGPIHSVDAFVDKAGTPHVLENVVDYQTGYDIGFDDNFHYSRILPSKLSAEQVAAVRDVAKLGCKALGIKNTAAHIEIIRTNEGPMIVEIGARNGGYRERMHRLANDIDILSIAIDLALGIEPVINATKNESVAVLELFPKHSGTFTGINGESSLQQLPSLIYFATKQLLGAKVGKASDGYKMCAVIILHNSDALQFKKDLQYVNDFVEILTS